MNQIYLYLPIKTFIKIRGCAIRLRQLEFLSVSEPYVQW